MIYVFKTSVATEQQAQQLKPYLDEALIGSAWNFDLHDCDKVLRVISAENIVLKIITLLSIHDFTCEELD